MRDAWAGVGVLLALVLAACGSSAPTGGTRPTGTITVSAASSLTEAFGRLRAAFEAAHPGTTVRLNLGSSATLATQIEQGAPADVLATADAATMATLADDDLVAGRARPFARNRLVIVTEPGNPHAVRTLADLARLDVVALCGETAPCGKYAATILRRARVTIPPDHVTRGQDVKATLAAVTTGDADAAIVYATDARAARRAVTTVRIPPAANAVATYPIAVLAEAGNRRLAREFVRFARSRAAERTLVSFGFLPAP